MDGQRFDNLTRTLATSTNRRRVLASLAGGLVAAVSAPLGARAACRGAGRRCTGGSQCCSGACDSATNQCACPAGTTPCRNDCKAPADYLSDLNNCGSCGARCTPSSPCHMPGCSGGVCNSAPDPQRVGRSCGAGKVCTADGSCVPFDPCAGVNCDDGDLCTTDHCEGGTCIYDAIPGCCHSVDDCPNPDDACRVATCDGNRCDSSPLAAGAPCGEGARCVDGAAYSGQTCDGNGTCSPDQTVQVCTPYTCRDATCLSACEADADCAPEHGCADRVCRRRCADDAGCANAFHCEEGLCLPDEELGRACDGDGDCQSGHCVNGVCCDAACDGQCVYCDAASGGVCTPRGGVLCEPDDRCAITGTCQNGACQPTGLIACDESTPCRPSLGCDPAIGCVYEDLPEGARCDDGNACTPNDVCQGGQCVGGGILICFPDDQQCQVPTGCDPATGCTYDDKPVGTPCDIVGDNDPCLSGACQAGACVVVPSNEGQSCTPFATSLDPCDFSPICTSGVCQYQRNACDDPDALGLDPCQEATCNGLGGCIPRDKPAGASCDDGSDCTNQSICFFTVGLGRLTCGSRTWACPGSACQSQVQGTDGATYYFASPESATCSDEYKCVSSGQCSHGTCVGSPAANGATCRLPGECHEPGVCVGGLCHGNGVLPDGTPCDDGHFCTQDMTCHGGICSGGSVREGNECTIGENDCCLGTYCLAGGSLIGEGFRTCKTCDTVEEKICSGIDGNPRANVCCPFQTCECRGISECQAGLLRCYPT